MSDPTDDDVQRMAFEFCDTASGPRCNNPCAVCRFHAVKAMKFGAKLPDLRMDRGRAAYEAHLNHTSETSLWKKASPQEKEAWARTAEAARAAP